MGRVSMPQANGLPTREREPKEQCHEALERE